MQNESIDNKLAVLTSHYSECSFAAHAQQDVEDIRNNATKVGLAVTAAAFGLNEVARLTLRSPFFKLKLQNVLFWAVVPTLVSRFKSNDSVDERVNNLWRIHQNRQEAGLGKTSNGGLSSEHKY
jgi:hypothetical protein